MATPLPLEGDGLVGNLFHYLWTTDDLGGGPRVSVPPTVVYRGSQPVAWYFTSRKSGRIKRKHRANLTAAHIEHSFTKKKATTDIVAYFLYLPKSESASPAIEYFDAEALREFLYKRPEIPNSSCPQSAGILQHFSLPKGARNSTLRAIWSPKLCLLERRVNVHAIHDARFSVYERGVTFEEGGGTEALSRPEPVRGSILPGMVQQLCERLVDHVTRVSYHKFRIARMMLRLQVDADDRLWLLWSSSLRLQPPLALATATLALDMPTEEPAIRPLEIVSDAKVPTFAFAQGSGGGPVSLSSASNLEANEEPRPGQTRCASCAQVVAHRALLPTTYKAVLAHFQQVLRFLHKRDQEDNQVAIEWPPDDRVVQQAGGVGFGILRHLKSVSSSSDDSGLAKAGSGLRPGQGRDLLVPPVIRYLHPTLRAEDFARHRQDPIFLHKTVGVCERCCLVYADYATASLEANALGIRSSASAPALLRPVRERPKHAEYFDDDPSDSLRLTTSPLARNGSKTKPPASAWKPVPTDERQRGKFKVGPRSTLHSLPMAPKLPPRIDTFESDDNEALRIPDGIHDGSPPHQQQQREEAFFRELYQQKDASKRGGHALRHILEAADRLSKAKPQHRLAALGESSRIGQSQSTGALVGAIAELKLAKKPGKSPYCIVQRIRDEGKGSSSKNQPVGSPSPAKTAPKQGSKQAKKKSPKKTQNQAADRAEKPRFVSSREKREAAAHRGYLVAALSDAQVQLEHIESLASLVISAADVATADPIEHESRAKAHRPTKSDPEDDKLLPSPQEQDSCVAHQVQDQEQFESEVDGQEQHEKRVHDARLANEEKFQELENIDPQAMDCAGSCGFDEEDESDHLLTHEEATSFEQGGRNDDMAEIQALGDTTTQEPAEKLKDDEASLERERTEAQLQPPDHELEYRIVVEHEQIGTPGPGQTHKFASEFARAEIEQNLQEQALAQGDEAQDEYEDEYEVADQEHGADQEDGPDTIDLQVKGEQEDAPPPHNLLEQAQELLAAAASSESDDADVALAHDASGGDAAEEAGSAVLSPPPDESSREPSDN